MIMFSRLVNELFDVYIKNSWICQKALSFSLDLLFSLISRSKQWQVCDLIQLFPSLRKISAISWDFRHCKVFDRTMMVFVLISNRIHLYHWHTYMSVGMLFILKLKGCLLSSYWASDGHRLRLFVNSSFKNSFFTVSLMLYSGSLDFFF